MQIEANRSALAITLTLTERELQLVERALYYDEPEDGAEREENFKLWSPIEDTLDTHRVVKLRDE